MTVLKTKFGDMRLRPDERIPEGAFIMRNPKTLECAGWSKATGLVTGTFEEVLRALESEAAPPVLREVQEREGRSADVQDVPRRDQDQ